MKLIFVLLLFCVCFLSCTQLPVSPEDLKPSPERHTSIQTQEAILPNTTATQMYVRMREYADKCLNTWREVSCGDNCKTLIKFTPTIVKEKNKTTLYLQRKGGVVHHETPMNGIYLMMAESLTNGKIQQLKVHGFESLQYGFTTQATVDWLSDRKKECPKL